MSSGIEGYKRKIELYSDGKAVGHFETGSGPFQPKVEYSNVQYVDPDVVIFCKNGKGRSVGAAGELIEMGITALAVTGGLTVVEGLPLFTQLDFFKSLKNRVVGLILDEKELIEHRKVIERMKKVLGDENVNVYTSFIGIKQEWVKAVNDGKLNR